MGPPTHGDGGWLFSGLGRINASQAPTAGLSSSDIDDLILSGPRLPMNPEIRIEPRTEIYQFFNGFLKVPPKISLRDSMTPFLIDVICDPLSKAERGRKEGRREQARLNKLRERKLIL